MSRRDSKNVEQAANELQTFQQYLRYFCMRFVHVVIHSRMGIPLEQPCDPNPKNGDWFNFKHDEFGEISAYLKKHIKSYPPQIPALCVDFILYTPSGDSLALESWVVRVSPTEVDENVNISSHLYRQLGTLLMSICVAARATPAARHYSRNQGEKTHVLCYRVLETEPELDLLGPEYKSILLGSYPSAFGSVQLELNYRTKMELSLPSQDGQENHQFTGETDASGIFLNASIPVKKPMEARSRLIVLSDLKPKAKNWSNPSSEGLPFIADMSRPRTLTPCQSAESEPAIPTLYQNLPAEILATMPEELKAPCGSTPRSEISISLKKRESFPFSMLSREGEDEQKEVNNAQSDSTSLSNFRFPLNANSSSDSSGASKRYDSESSTSSSIRETVRLKQRKTDDVFGFLEDEEHAVNKTIEIKDDLLASSPLQAFIHPPEEIGPDLEDFVKEVSMAPRNIGSFNNDDMKLLTEQLEYFKQKAPTLDNFIESMRDSLEQET